MSAQWPIVAAPAAGPDPDVITEGGPWQPRTVDQDGPTGLTFDRADLDEPATTATAGTGWAGTGRDPIFVRDLGCGHLDGEGCDDECAYWRGVLTGDYPEPEMPAEVIVLRPFNLRALAAQHITAAEQDRIERGAA